MKRPIMNGVAGGTGSGKSTVAKRPADHFSGSVRLIEQDAYYKDESHIPFEERHKPIMITQAPSTTTCSSLIRKRSFRGVRLKNRNRVALPLLINHIHSVLLKGM